MKRFKGDVDTLNTGQHIEKAFRNLQKQFECQQLCDVVLIAEMDGTRISAHRNVLAASSEYFLTMFTGSLRESHEKEVSIGEVCGDTLAALVNYCYSGTVDLREDNVETILATASLMQLDDVFSYCFDFLMRNLNPSNCLDIAQLAENYDCIDIQRKVEAFIHQYFVQISQTKEFLEFSPELLCKLVGNDEIAVQSEKDVFKSCITWIQHDRVNREKFIHQILSVIRLPLLPSPFITKYVKPLCTTAECKDLLIEAYEWHLQPELRNELATVRTKERKWSEGILLALGRGNKNNLLLQSYCPERDDWTKWNITLPKWWFVAAILDDTLFIVESVHDSKPSGAFDSINLKSSKMTTLTPLQTPRKGMSCAVLDDCFYIVGGRDAEGVTLNSVERWNPLTGTWSYVTAMSVPRHGAAVVVLNELMYAIGGSNLLAIQNTSECYNPYTNKWYSRAPLNVGRQFAGVAAGRGFLYIIGGWADQPPHTNTVERYDPIADQWTLLCSISTGRGGINCAFLGNRLFAAGGFDRKWQSKVEEYDFENDTWSEKNALAEGYTGVSFLNVPHMIPPKGSNAALT